VAGASETNVDRRERLRKLALETIDLAKVCAAPLVALSLDLKLFAGPIHPTQPSWLTRMSSLSHSSHQ
jgi:hypothetical protein